MQRGHNNIHEPGADRTGSNRFKNTGDEKDIERVREANENVRKEEGDEPTETPNGRSGNRPRFDRDR